MTSDDKIEPDFGSFTQMTFDNNHPNYQSAFVGIKKGNKTVVKDPAVKVLGGGAPSDT